MRGGTRLLSLVLSLGAGSSMGFELWLDLRTGATPGASQPPNFAAAFDRQLLPPEDQSSERVEGLAVLSVQPSDRLVEGISSSSFESPGKLVDGTGRLVGAAVAVGSANAQNDALSLVGSVEVNDDEWNHPLSCLAHWDLRRMEPPSLPPASPL